MEQLAQRVLATLFGLRGPTVYALVGALAWGEAAFFLGLVTPGELAMAGGGVLASRGQAAVAWVAGAAALGTVLGSSTGYWLGRAWGTRLLDWAPLQRRLGRPIEATRSYLGRRGEWAIVLSKLASYVRIFVPFMVGASGMSYGRFAAFDVPAGAAWAAGLVLLGFALGESWDVLLEAAGPAAFLVLILFVLALAIRWLAVRVARREEPIEAAARRMVATRAVRWLVGRLGAGPVRWLARRFDPRVARGLGLTLGFLVLLAGAGSVGLVLDQTRAVQGLARIDFPVLQWMAATRTEAAVWVARTGLWPFQSPGLAVPALLLAAFARWRVGWGAAARAAVGVLGSGFGAQVLDEYVLVGLVPGAQFPSVAVATAAALLVHATALAGARLAWSRIVATAAVGLFGACTVALATIVAGWAAPSGIALGFALGLAWSTAVEVQGRLV